MSRLNSLRRAAQRRAASSSQPRDELGRWAQTQGAVSRSAQPKATFNVEGGNLVSPKTGKAFTLTPAQRAALQRRIRSGSVQVTKSELQAINAGRSLPGSNRLQTPQVTAKTVRFAVSGDTLVSPKTGKAFPVPPQWQQLLKHRHQNGEVELSRDELDAINKGVPPTGKQRAVSKLRSIVVKRSTASSVPPDPPPPSSPPPPKQAKSTPPPPPSTSNVNQERVTFSSEADAKAWFKQTTGKSLKISGDEGTRSIGELETAAAAIKTVSKRFGVTFKDVEIDLIPARKTGGAVTILFDRATRSATVEKFRASEVNISYERTLIHHEDRVREVQANTPNAMKLPHEERKAVLEKEAESVRSKRYDYSYQFSNTGFDPARNFEVAVYHEIGHVLHTQQADKFERFFGENPNKAGRKQKLVPFSPTAYGKTNSHEAIAESFAMYMTGREHLIHPKMKEFFDNFDSI